MEARDEAMDFKCKGGMMDCDGDRREFAKAQWDNYQKRMLGQEEGEAEDQARMQNSSDKK